MPLKKSLWKRDTKCLVCETPIINYQFMTKSQNIEYDEWMVTHYHPIGDYDRYPEVLKTTICPNCLTASNEYGFGVDQYIYFTRNTRKHELTKKFFEEHISDRFEVLCEVFHQFEVECAILDKQNNRPTNTRTQATLKKIWSAHDQYAIPFFNLLFKEPRDHATALACFAVDRYCQMLRIAFNYDHKPERWRYNSLQEQLVKHYQETPLDIKQPEPRFYFITTNYLQSIQLLEELIRQMGPACQIRQQERLNDYWRSAVEMMELSLSNDDLNALPLETKEGGANLLMAKLYFKFNHNEEGKKCLRVAKKYADNRLKHIASNNQQNFVNEVDDLYEAFFVTSKSNANEMVKR